MLIIERRENVDRRNNEAPIKFPIITTQGVCLRRDRRHAPERRISNIQVEEQNMEDSAFELIFHKKKKDDNR